MKLNHMNVLGLFLMSKCLKLPPLYKVHISIKFSRESRTIFEPLCKQHVLVLCQLVFQLTRVNHFRIFSSICVCDFMLNTHDCL